MYKVVWFARFSQGMAKEDAGRYWAEHHGPLCAGTDIERYVQNHVIGRVPSVSGGPGDETFFDGYSLGWWSDRDAFDATMESPGWKALGVDGDNVFDMNWLRGMSASLREFVVIDGPMSPFKVLWMVRFKEGLDTAEAHTYWENVHGSIFKALEIDRYVQNHVVGEVYPGTKPGFDGFSECWFKDEEQFLRALGSEAWADAVVDGNNIFDTSQLWRAVVNERVVKSGVSEFAGV